MDKKEFRVLIEHCFLMGKNTVEAKQWLDKRYGDSAPGKSTIIDWYSEFKRGRTNTDNAERSGRPKSAFVPENITKVHKIVLGDCKLKLREIADTLKISEGSALGKKKPPGYTENPVALTGRSIGTFTTLG